MKKPDKLGLKLIGLVFFGALLGCWVYFDLPCVFRFFTGIPCPTCTMSRAWLSALRLQFQDAFLYHPFFWSIPVLVLFLFFDGQLFPNPRVNTWILTGLLTGIFLVYAIRLVGFSSGLYPL